MQLKHQLLVIVMLRYLEIFSVFAFSLLISLGSSGVSVHKMSCLSSGRVVHSLEKSFCFVDEESSTEQETISATCCEYQETDFKVNNFRLSNVISFVAVLPITEFFTQMPLSVTDSIRHWRYFEIPPLPTSNRLAILGLMVI